MRVCMRSFGAIMKLVRSLMTCVAYLTNCTDIAHRAVRCDDDVRRTEDTHERCLRDTNFLFRFN